MSPHLAKRADNDIFSCPNGGTWYACTTGSNFVGCCASDACTINGCAQGNVFQPAFNVSAYSEFPDASCGLSSDFYTCAFGKTFWGCCKSDPCSTTDAVCPKGNLVPAFMERTEQFNFYTSATKSDGGSSNAATIGGAVGGGVGAALLIGLLIWFLCRRKKQRKQQYTVGAVTDPADPNGREKAGATDSTYYGLQSPPPTYTSPNPNMYSDSPHTPKDGHYQYAHISDTPQELPGNNHDSLGQNRFSELPAESSNTHRYSELPDNAALRTAELESPQTSPQPLQTEFRRDVAKTGLGGDENTRH